MYFKIVDFMVCVLYVKKEKKSKPRSDFKLEGDMVCVHFRKRVLCPQGRKQIEGRDILTDVQLLGDP